MTSGPAADSRHDEPRPVCACGHDHVIDNGAGLDAFARAFWAMQPRQTSEPCPTPACGCTRWRP